jgi:hypothetical protein
MSNSKTGSISRKESVEKALPPGQTVAQNTLVEGTHSQNYQRGV